jgi:acetyl-CoA synthetase
MNDKFLFGGEFVWKPSQEYIERAHLTHFMQRHNISNFEDLLQRSTTDVAWFTDAILKYLDVHFQQPYTHILDISKGIAWPEWCIGGKLNIVYNCIDKYVGTPAEDHIALICETERGEVNSLTYGELYRKVNQAANALRSLGLKKGDVIGLFMPMVCEIVVATLAIAKIGGIILPLFSGYGSGAIASRLAEANARALFTADGFFRRNQPIFLKPIADQAANLIPSVKHIIVLNLNEHEINMLNGRDHWWHKLIEGQPDQAASEITAAEDILMILFTSGTTGKPKGVVHTHCGFPVKAAQDMAFGTDIHPGDRIHWITDMGWMMGPWLVFGALLLGGTIITYDGAPDYPGPSRLWDLVERHKITTLGVSPTLVRASIGLGEAPFRDHDLSSLRFFASTGEPWNPDPWMWLFKGVGKGKRPIINYSGGTEISGGILMGNPLQPLKPCAFSAPCPGMDVDVFNEQGKPVRNQVGELVVKAPWIGMTRGFWNDPKRYEETYWSRWPGVWVHGDFAAIDSDGMWYILGRSDDTIKLAGKRIGPAEIESVLVSHSGVLEAAAIGVPDEVKGNSLVVFCVLVSGTQPSDSLQEQLKQHVVKVMGKPMTPKEILFVDDLPKTRNAKLMRRTIRATYLDQPPGDISSLVNPQSLNAIRKVKLTTRETRQTE